MKLLNNGSGRAGWRENCEPRVRIECDLWVSALYHGGHIWKQWAAFYSSKRERLDLALVHQRHIVATGLM